MPTVSLILRLQKVYEISDEFQNSKISRFLKWDMKWNVSCIPVHCGDSGQQQLETPHSPSGAQAGGSSAVLRSARNRC